MPSAPMTPITDHVQQALGKLITRYKNKPRFAAWVASHVRQVQLLEDAAWQVIDSRDVDTCDETRLRLIAKLVGQPVRGTLEQLRLYVQVRILVNRSNGRIPTVLKIARLLLGDVAFSWGPPAHYTIEMLEALDGRDPNYSAELIRDATLAGVGVDLVYNTSEPEDALIGSYDPDEVDADRGGSYDGSTGGFGAALA
jgi:hypothetical protein